MYLYLTSNFIFVATLQLDTSGANGTSFVAANDVQVNGNFSAGKMSTGASKHDVTLHQPLESSCHWIFAVADSESDENRVGWSSLIIGDEGNFSFDPHGDMFVVGSISSGGVFSASAALDIADATLNPSAAG